MEEPAKKGSLFGGTTASFVGEGTQKFGLFSGTKKTDSSTEENGGEKKTTSLFGGAAPKTTGSLFGNPPAGGTGLFGTKPPPAGSLFGAPAPGGLFGAANAGASIFGSAAPATTTAKKDEEGGDSELYEGEDEAPVYADTAKVEFKGTTAQAAQPSPYTRLFEVSIVILPFYLIF